MPDVVNLVERCAGLAEHWAPETVASANGQEFKVARVQREYTWHQHSTADETFVVLEEELVVQLRDGEVRLGAGDLYVVPMGMEHRPVSERETLLLVVEPPGVVSRGDWGSCEMAAIYLLLIIWWA